MIYFYIVVSIPRDISSIHTSPPLRPAFHPRNVFFADLRGPLPFFLGRAPSAARIPLSLSPSPPPFPLVSHASSTSSRYLLLVSRPRADLDATRLDPREKRRNESGTPLELLMLLRSRRIPPRLLNRLISAGKMNGSINTSFRADHPRVDEEALLLDRTLISRTFGRLKLVVPIYTLRGSLYSPPPPPPSFLFLFLLDSIESFESKGVSPVDIYISPNYNRLK